MFTNSDSRSNKSSYSEKASGTNAVTAGDTASLDATGGDVTLQGANVKATDVGIAASNDVNLLSLALNSNSESSSTSSSIGGNVTVGMNTGNGETTPAQSTAGGTTPAPLPSPNGATP
jgi:filamentous hemagglutinin